MGRDNFLELSFEFLSLYDCLYFCELPDNDVDHIITINVVPLIFNAFYKYKYLKINAPNIYLQDLLLLYSKPVSYLSRSLSHLGRYYS